MKKIALLLGLFISMGAQATPPEYSLESPEILGGYRLPRARCLSTGPSCDFATIKKVRGRVVVELPEYEQTITLRESAGGRLTFSWENPENDDCDDPGCGNLLKVSGVVYPRKVGRSYVSTLKLYVTMDYPFPDEEDAPSGETVETESYIHYRY